MSTRRYRDYEIVCEIEKKCQTPTGMQWKGTIWLRQAESLSWSCFSMDMTAPTQPEARHKCVQSAKAAVDGLIGPQSYFGTECLAKVREVSVAPSTCG